MSYQAIFDLSNNLGEEVIESICKKEEILKTIIDSLDHYNPTIKKQSLLIIGNILAERE